jgi:antitoxin CptB
MDEEDNDLQRWILGTLPVPEHLMTPLFSRIASYKPDFDEMTAKTFGNAG